MLFLLRILKIALETSDLLPDKKGKEMKRVVKSEKHCEIKKLRKRSKNVEKKRQNTKEMLRRQTSTDNYRTVREKNPLDND